jgi:hypothetical protein
MTITRNMPLKLICILQLKTIEKDSDNFWHKKLTFKVAWFRTYVDLPEIIFMKNVLLKKLTFDAKVTEKFLNIV